MNERKLWIRGLVAVVLCAAVFGAADRRADMVAADQSSAASTGAPHASPIAITSDHQLVWSVTPDNDPVSVFNVVGDANEKVAEVPVDKEPWCVAITPDDEKVYVTNMASGTVSVIDQKNRNVVRTMGVGTEP